MTTLETTVPLNRLVLSKANVRRTGRAEGIEALAASIHAHGLRQNLNVQPSTKVNHFEVVAGARRLAALKRLVKAKKLAKDAPIPCRVLDEGDDPAEISLCENAMRLAMHPDDQCDAFRALIEERGYGIEEVAARFGVTPAVVARRLKLAAVSPKLRALYRQGELDLDQMMAFTVADDHAAQEEAWESLSAWNRTPHAIRAVLTQEAVPATERMAVFVGVDAYVAAGGAVMRDLFDDEDAGYLTDRALLLRLANDRLAAEIETVRAEGWKWVIAEAEPDYGTRFDRIFPQEGDDGTEAYASEDMTRAGARLRIGYDGRLNVERGLVHLDDVACDPEAAHSVKPKAQPGSLSGRMVEELTAHRTAALRVELSGAPAVALAAVVHALALSLLFPSHPAASCLALRGSSEPLDRHAEVTGDSPAHQTMAQQAERWGERLPKDPGDLLAWCFHQTQDDLLDCLAFLAGLSVNAVQATHDRAGSGRLAHADRLVEALALDMTRHWSPTIDGFYRRLPRATLVQAVTEARAPLSVNLASLKKDEAARYVAKAMAGTGWLPSPLRGSGAATVYAPA